MQSGSGEDMGALFSNTLFRASGQEPLPPLLHVALDKLGE